MDLPGFIPGNTGLGGEYTKIFIWMGARVARTTFQVWKCSVFSPFKTTATALDVES
jgi:hypothetical protein